MGMPRHAPWWWEAVDPLRTELHHRLRPPDGDRVLAYLLSWFNVQEQIGRVPTRDEYQKSTHLTSARMASYEGLFSSVFPSLQTPSDVFDRLSKLLDAGRVASLFEGVDQ